MIPDTDQAAAGFLFHIIQATEVDQPEQVVGQSWVTAKSESYASDDLRNDLHQVVFPAGAPLHCHRPATSP
jgi:hypothetical protein